jgi:hypothetical protein
MLGLDDPMAAEAGSPAPRRRLNHFGVLVQNVGAYGEEKEKTVDYSQEDWGWDVDVDRLCGQK